MGARIYLLGGYQTDFARNWTREGLELADLCGEAVRGALAETDLSPAEIDCGHVGNFIGELLSGQGHLGGLFVEADPGFAGKPVSRHEGACASGSLAVLAASADLEAGRYGTACVLGVELMRGVPGVEASRHLGAAAWVPRETDGVDHPWPHLFSRLGEEYDERYGLDRAHLEALSRQAFDAARANPRAQARKWRFDDDSFGLDAEKNPVISGMIRKQDCSQITDGAAALVLAREDVARDWARARGRSLADLPYLRGWGHRTDRMALEDKLEASRGEPFVLPQVRATIEDAFRRAELSGVEALDAIETHDCFTTTWYAAIDHFGLTPPGESWRAIEEGRIGRDGKLPMNPGGGLMGIGHPVGATGVRMLLDAARQVTGRAEGYQVEGARTVATLNIGGSATTTACFVVGREE